MGAVLRRLVPQPLPQLVCARLKPPLEAGRYFDEGMPPRTDVPIPIPGGEGLGGTLAIPEGASGFVLFAHGTGSSRFSPRNRSVARVLNDAGLATLLMDLLTEEEEKAERFSGHLRFDIGMLADRLRAAMAWLTVEHPLPLGLFGASTGAAAALIAAARDPERVRAVVSRGGRPDLAGDALEDVRAPTLLIVGSLDTTVIDLNEQARARINATVEVKVVAGASHLFEEPGTLEQVATLAREWFRRYLA
jgi:putative phosphoribosyl transferase